MRDSSQTDLFGAVPAPTAPADPGVTRLKVLPRGREKLSPAQQRFNKLLARVDNLGRQVQNIQRLVDAVRAPHLERVSGLERRITQTQTDMALFLHERLQRKGLTAAQKKSVRSILESLLQVLEPEDEDSPLAALRSVYFPPEEQALSLQDAKRQVLDAMEATLGRPLDLEGLDDIDSPEELLASVMRKVQDERQAEEDRQAKRQAQRPAPNDRQAAQGPRAGAGRQDRSAHHLPATGQRPAP